MQYKYLGIDFILDQTTSVHEGDSCIVLVRPVRTERTVCIVEGICFRIGWHGTKHKWMTPNFVRFEHSTNHLLASLLMHCENKVLFPVPECILVDVKNDPFIQDYLRELLADHERGYRFKCDKDTVDPFEKRRITVDFWKSLS